MPKKITAYSCEFKCRKVLTKKSAMVEHESRCFHNPVTRSCATCGNFVKEDGYTNPDSSFHPFTECTKGVCIGFKLQTQCDLYIAKG